MKKLFLLIFISTSIIINAQVDVTAGMGVAFVNNSSLTDYINIYYASEDQLGTFNSSFDLSLEADYTISENFQMGIEYVYNIYSYTTPLPTGLIYDLSYNHHKPSILAYYVLPGAGYKFKIGGGVGYRMVDLDEKIYEPVNYTASGFGFLLRAQGLTTLGGNFYANLGGTFRYDLPGELSGSNDIKSESSIESNNVNINSIVFSVNIGVSYSF